MGDGSHVAEEQLVAMGAEGASGSRVHVEAGRADSLFLRLDDGADGCARKATLILAPWMASPRGSDRFQQDRHPSSYEAHGAAAPGLIHGRIAGQVDARLGDLIRHVTTRFALLSQCLPHQKATAC